MSDSDGRPARAGPSGATLEQLKQLDVGQWKKKSFRGGERVLTLEEVLAIIGGKVDLCLDIKQFKDSQPGIEIKLLFTLSHYDYLDQTIFFFIQLPVPGPRPGVCSGSAHRGDLRYRHREDPFGAAERLGAGSIHVQKEAATRPFLDKAWEAGLDIHVWTVNSVHDMEKFAALGVQGDCFRLSGKALQPNFFHK